MPKRTSKGSKNATASCSSADAHGLSGAMANGFRTVPELDPVSVREENISPFSLPAEALTFSPPPDAVICTFKNGDKERKIYCNVEYQAQEMDLLKRLQKDAREQGVAFYPSVAAMATRYLSRARGDVKKALKLMQATQEWRRQYFKEGPISDASVAEDLKHGIVYFSGRDRNLRPAIVVRAIRIPQRWYKEKCIDRLIRVLVFCMEYMLRYMLIPGKVENNCLIVDLKGLSWSQVPIGALKDIYSIMSHHYIGRVFKFYVCNLSGALSTIASMAKALLTDRQKQKLVVLDNMSELRKEYALHQLEEDFGGTRPRISEFFPFPMPPGPFEGGSARGPSEGAVPGAHDLLARDGACGRLWDPELSRADNERLEYSPKAAGIFEKCDLPIPPECLRHKGLEGGNAGRGSDASSGGAKAEASARPFESLEEESTQLLENVCVETVESNGSEGDTANGDADDVVFDGAVKQRGWCGCKAYMDGCPGNRASSAAP